MPDIFVNQKDAGSDTGKEPVSQASMDVENTSSQTQTMPPQHDENYEDLQAEIEQLPGGTKHVLSSFFFLPQRVEFINKDDKEKVLLLLRKHPITNIPWILLTFVLIIAPAFLSVVPLIEEIPSNFLFVFTMLWYMFTTAFALEKFLTWFFHVNIITNERMIEVDFPHLLYREITDANIDQIQDVTPQVGGTLRTMFNYGDIIVQTSAAIPMITFEAVPKPDHVAKVLRKIRIEEDQEKLEGRVQ